MKTFCHADVFEIVIFEMMPILLRLLCIDAMSVCQSVSDLHLSIFWAVCLCLFLSLPVSLSLFVPLPVSHFVSLSLLLPCPLTLSLSLSHPVLGWLYVFSPFPPRPRPPLQKLFPLTSKPFELNLKCACLRDKVRTTHRITTKRGSIVALVMVITWLDFGEVLLETGFFANFL